MDVLTETFAQDVYTIMLNRPDKKNAMSLELIEGLRGALERAEKATASVVVIRGAGKTFCAGGDIMEFREATDGAQIDAMADALHQGIRKIRRMNAIVIAVVEGLAFGAGLSLALACDLTVAEKKAVMNMAYRRIGLSPDGGGSLFLSRLVGMKRVNEFYLLSRNIDMQEAKEIGLVNFVFGEEELEAKLGTLINELKGLPMESVGYFKELINASLFFGLDTHLDRERLGVTRFGSTNEFKQRLEKLFKKG